VLSLQQMLCIVPRHVNTSFNTSSHRRYVLFEKFFLTLLIGIVCCCNTCQSLPGPEYARVFTCPCIVCLWTRLLFNWGWDVEAKSTGLHDPSDFNPVEFWLCGHSETSVYSNMINDIEELEPWLEISCLSGDSSKMNFWKSVHFIWEKELKVLLTCMGTTQSICCRDNMKITHISAGIGFFDICWLRLYCSLISRTIFPTTCIISSNSLGL